MRIKISKQELQSMGCLSCIWKSHKQCPYDLNKDESYDSTIHKDGEESERTSTSKSKSLDSYNGICPEYLEFILSFAEDDDSVNTLWEKFSLYIARLQSMNDYQEFLQLRDEIKEKEEYMDNNEKVNYDIKLNTLRLWWERLNDTVRKGYGRIADRESKSKEGSRLPGIMNAKTINFNIEQKEGKSIDGIEKKKLEDKNEKVN